MKITTVTFWSTMGVLMMSLLPSCQQASPSLSPAAVKAEEQLATLERTADTVCPKAALRVHEAAFAARDAVQRNNAEMIAVATDATTTAAKLCQLEKENCGTGPARLGMSTHEVIHSSWCFPDTRNTTETARQMHEQWVYKGRGYLYFDNDRLTAIQNEGQ